MKLTDDEVREIQRLYIDGTPVRELARCYGVDDGTIRHHCRGVIGEPIRRLERAEIMYLLYVKYPLERHANIDALWRTVSEMKSFYPRLSRMTRMRFGQVVTQTLNELGWERSGQSSRCYTFCRPVESRPVTLEW